MSAFKTYIQALCRGPLLAATVHASVLSGYATADSDKERVALWEALKQELGEAEALRRVKTWIAKPYRIKE